MASVDRPTRQRALAISWIWRDGGATPDTSVCRVSQVLPLWPLRFETARLHETTTNPLVRDAVDAAGSGSGRVLAHASSVLATVSTSP
jgi:hypothetical protein